MLACKSRERKVELLIERESCWGCWCSSETCCKLAGTQLVIDQADSWPSALMSITSYNGSALIGIVVKNCFAIASDRRLRVNIQTIACNFKLHDELYIGLSRLATYTQTMHQRLNFRHKLYQLREQCNMAVTFFNSPSPIYSSFMLCSSHGGRNNGRQRWSSLDWKRFSTNASASGEQTIDELWKEYFADPSQWWDNRGNKGPKAPDFKHKVTRKAVWIDGWSTPSWVKVMLKSVTEGKLQPHIGSQTQGFPNRVRPNGLLQNKNVQGNSYVSSREPKQFVHDYDASMHNASTMTEAISILKNLIQIGIAVDSNIYVEVLERCYKSKDIVSAKQIHECIVRSGMEQNVYVATKLVRVYIRCGRLQDAHHVFDELVNKSVITWNVMIGGLAQHGRGQEAYELFLKMQRVGIVPNAFTYTSILKPCARMGVLKWMREVHSHALKVGLELDLRVANALIHMYAKSGSIDDAQEVFDRMEDRDVITWNVMIGGFAQHGRGQEAYEFFLKMQRDGIVPDAFTYASILNPCASAGALEWVKEIHSHALKAGLESDLRVGSALVHMYAKCGSIDDAQGVFERMLYRDVITWTLIIGGLAQHGRGQEAYELFIKMQRDGIVPDAFTYASILNPCASAGALEWVKDVHNHAFKAGLESDLRVSNALVHMYSKSGSIDDARGVFDKMVYRDVITWTMMIGGLAQHGRGQEAYELFLKMQKDGIVPDAFTYASILNPSASIGALEWVKEVHSHAFKAGLESDLRVANALVHMYSKSGSIDDVQGVFEKMKDRNVITWNVMIGGLAQHGRGQEAYELFLKMQEDGIIPDAYTYANILHPSAGALEWVKEVHNHALKAGLELDLRVGSALVHMYAKSGSIDDAQRIFDRMKDRDVVTWNLIISGLAQHGRGQEALQLFGKMNEEGVKPDEFSFMAVLLACSHVGLIDEGRRQFLAMTQDFNIKPSVEHFTCMVDLLGRAGLLEEAKLFIQNMPLKPDGAIWGALLGACRAHNNVEMAEFVFEERLKLEPNDASSYVLLSNIYAAVGKWDKVSLIRIMMQERGICKEPGVSWIEVDNKIHRFVVGDKSHLEAKKIHAKLKTLTRKLKAVGYTPDTRLVLHNIDEADKELALCSHSEKLAIGYGLLNIPHGKPIRIYKNLQVCSDCHTATKIISKVTGREIIARDANRFHHFKDGVCSCGDYW